MKIHSTIAPSALLATVLFGLTGTAAGQETEDVIIVRGALVPDEKQATSEISSLLDVEDFKRTGDTDVAAALSRVSGISLSGGRFPVARGLDERYTSATLNRVPIPSPEPLRRAAPLDLIPTDILAGTLAQKTYSPEYSAEFGGAAIDLQTIAVPAESFLSAAISFEGNTVTTLSEGLFYEGSDTDIFAFDDGTRDFPDTAERFFREGRGVVDQQDLDTSFEQDDTLLITDGIVPANGSAELGFGKVYEGNDNFRAGTSFFFRYDNEWQIRDTIEFRTNSSNPRDSSRLARNNRYETRQEVDLNAFNVTGIETTDGDHSVALTSYVLRSSLKQASISNDVDLDISANPIRRERTGFLTRQVWQTQLGGEHVFRNFNDFEAAWRIAYGEASRNNLYDRTTTRIYSAASDAFLFSSNGQANTLEFSFLDDQNFFAGVDFTQPVYIFDRIIELRSGASYRDNERETLRRDFDFGRGAQLPTELRAKRIDLIYSDPLLETDLVNASTVVSLLFPDASEASLDVFSGYGIVDAEITENLRASVGVRAEDGTERSAVILTTTDVRQEFDPIEEGYILPAVTVTYNPFGNVQLRTAYSETITRPQFRELAVADFLDPDLDVTLRGNPYLVNSELKNYDIRAEWYFDRGQFITLGGFYKEIDNPIEQYQTGGEGDQTSFINAPEAKVYGVEAEFQKRFGFDRLFGDNPSFYDKEFFFGANYTWSESEVNAGDGTVIIASAPAPVYQPITVPAAGFIREGRRLQGQSEHLVNFQAGIENIETGFRLTALLNYASDRLLFAGSPDGANLPVFEKPPVTLDLVLAQNFVYNEGDYALGIKLRNLLQDEFNTYRVFEGDRVPFLAFDLGTDVSFTLSRDF